MPAVAVREAVDAHEAMFEPQGDFIGRVGVVIVPVSQIIQQGLQRSGNLPVVDADILVGSAKRTGPVPHLTKHAFMQFPDKFFGKYSFRPEGTSQRPLYGLFNVLLFKLIQLTTRSYGGNAQPLLLLFVQWCLAVYMIEI
jgi:hypothetical protein